MPRLHLAALLLGLTLGSLAPGIAATPPLIKSDSPASYTVRKGDTLWDIAGMFLDDPWRWPEIWQVNRQIENPHLIFPGDNIRLVDTPEGPRVRVQRGLRVVKLSPRVRVEPLDRAIPTVRVDAIAPFLTRPFVLDQDQIEAAPYVVHFVDEHIVGGTGDYVYVRSIEDEVFSEFEIVRPGDAYRDAATGELLGYAAKFVAQGRLARPGDPAKLLLTQSRSEVAVGDRALPSAEERTLTNFFPKPAPANLRGNIISVLDGVSQIGQFNVVVLDRGSADGVARGDVMRIYRSPRQIRDPIAGSRWHFIAPGPFHEDQAPPLVARPLARVTLPSEESGVLMVFRTFARVSFALVMRAHRPIHLYDTVRSVAAT
jgi:hypothetical protein